MKEIVKSWLNRYKKYFFAYREGFFELPYLANSPELIMESYKSMPFVKNYPKSNYFTTNNIFLKGDGHYQKIEDGLWVMLSDLKIKKDLSFKLYYDPNVPANFHFLTLYINKNKKTIHLPKIHIDVENQDRSWILHKAGSQSFNTHFKGQESIFLVIYFNHEWLKKNMMTNEIMDNSYITSFFNSKLDSLFLPNFLEDKKLVYENLVESILEKDENGVKNLVQIKIKTLDIISSFISSLNQNGINELNNSIPERDRRKLFKVEYLLRQAIFDEFPSISVLAKQVGVSETKLKSDFKVVYKTTLYQYFVKKQMMYAKEILLSKNMQIKEVAYSLGYNNPSKFSSAFQKIHGYLPSQL